MLYLKEGVPVHPPLTYGGNLVWVTTQGKRTFGEKVLRKTSYRTEAFHTATPYAGSRYRQGLMLTSTERGQKLTIYTQLFGYLP